MSKSQKALCKQKRKTRWKPKTAERTAVLESAKKHQERVPAPRVKIRRTSENKIAIDPDHLDVTAWRLMIDRAFGSTEEAFSDYQLDLLLCAITDGRDISEREANAALATMHGIRPRDEIEGMLAAQMIAIHRATMEVSRRLINSSSVDHQTSASNALSKLTRTYTMQMEALNRHRGKGQQKVEVKHVHVHEGGQAIVGVVEAKGGGGKAKTGAQAHALIHAPGVAMPRKNPKRDTVPSTSHSRKKAL